MKVKYFERNGFSFSDGNDSKQWNEKESGVMTIHRNAFIIPSREEELLYDLSFKRVYPKLKGICIMIIALNVVNQSYLIKLNWFQYWRFLWIQKKHWLQSEENLRYAFNVILIIAGMYLMWLSLPIHNNQ